MADPILPEQGRVATLPRGEGDATIDPTIAPYLAEALGRARYLFLQGPQPEMFPGQMYVSPSEQTLAAIQAQENIARQQQPILSEAQNVFLRGLQAQSAAAPLYQNIYGAAGFQPGAPVYEQFAAGQFAPETAGLQNVAQQYGNVAGGSFLTGSPYQQALIEQSTRPITEQLLEQTLPALQSQFSRAGRYGSGAQERAIEAATRAAARAVGETATNIGAQTYAQERGFQEAARGAQAGILGQIAGLQQTGFGNILAGAQGLQGAQQAALGTQLAAAGGLGGVQQQALATQLATAQAAPAAFQQQFLPAQTLAQVGAQREAIAAQPLQEQMQRFQFQQQLPYSQLQSYLSSIYGNPLSAAQQPQQQGSSTMQNIGGLLGIGLMGTQLYGGLKNLGVFGSSGISANPFMATSP
jgi:hypothetical protein